MMILRKATQRGRTRFGWLDSWHTFSFGSYHDEQFMGFHSLRVINDDIVSPGGGFDMHPHKNMEIITYVLDGELAHEDSLGNHGRIKQGEFQYMNAGTGIRHSEFNASKTAPVHLLQIWIIPPQTGLAPSYGEWAPVESDSAKELVVASKGGALGGMSMHQDVTIRLLRPAPNDQLTLAPSGGRSLWVHVVHGDFTVEDKTGDKIAGQLVQGDSLGVVSSELTLRAESTQTGARGLELLVFDLA